MSNSRIFRAVLDWFDSRIGLTNTMLRPVPENVLNPISWLGALAVIAFLIQGATGALILIYYVPSPSMAYSSTMYVIENVPLGHLLETIHLYNAYAMILLAFMHLTRNYFLSLHKKPRELMWVTGVLLGFVVLGFGLTGYLLPWTVVSKSATDVAVGMLGLVPGQLGLLMRFLIVGPGGDDAILRRFLFLHIVVFPAVLMAILAIKMYMFEIHGPPDPGYGRSFQKSNILPWFPGVLFYLLAIASAFVALLLAVSALFPLSLPPAFTPAAASSEVVQPDWYFLWIYQILKFSAFEGSRVEYALGGITVLMIFLFLLPFVDRRMERRLASRPVYVTIGLIILSEFIALTVWGYLTPGQVISNSQAIVILGGVALIIMILSWAIYRVRKVYNVSFSAER